MTSKPKNNSVSNTTLIIVESPTKARTLGKYLGPGYQIIASGGHIIDLPAKNLGVDIENNFKPDYKLIPGKGKIAKSLVTAARSASEILLATDPDREGEAIAWHISRYIGKNLNIRTRRVAFNEITKRAVQYAVENPGEIDMRKVDAQQARRVMDRVVGYQVSPVLWRTITGGLSAGRVQSVALRMIVEREAEIVAFIPEEYWTIESVFENETVKSLFSKLFRLDGNKVEIPDKDSSDRIVSRIKEASYRITDITKTRKKRQPYPPYITSTLQQDAGRRLGFTVKRTMSIAQRLYEGLEIGQKGQTGLITYMRTDSTRISNDANNSLREWIVNRYGIEGVSDKVRVYKNKKGAVQDAHEAIRPTDVHNTPESLKPFLKQEEFKLYDLIWRRFAATQMRNAEIDVTTVTISDGKGIEFRSTGQVIDIPGFLLVYSDINGTGGQKDDKIVLPAGMEVGMSLDLIKLDPNQHFTQPPPRYTEAGLVKALDELGIGRPSTYSSIISTLVDRKYVDRIKRSFEPTDLGKTVNKILTDSFPDIFNVKFTARMEEELDLIETGSNWQKVVSDFYIPFSAALNTALENSKKLKAEALQPVGRDCPDCSKPLVYRWSRRGRFISCSGFPDCHHAESIEKLAEIEVTEKCPKCDGEMMLREGRFGKFLGCKDYPKCKGVLPFSTGFDCPEENCSGKIAEKRSKKGRTFYSCDQYPKCKFTIWDKPVAGPCPQCETAVLFEKSNRSGTYKYCNKCKWKSEE